MTIWGALGFVVSVLALFLLMFSSTQGKITWFLDFPSMFGIVGIASLVMVASGMMRDFFRVFTICYARVSNASKEKDTCEGK